MGRWNFSPAAGGAQEIGEPPGDLAAAILGEQALALPDLDGKNLGRRRRPQRHGAGTAVRRTQDQFVRGERGLDQRHARQRALREELVVLVHEHEAPIADEAERVDFPGRRGEAAQGFDGIYEQAGDVHRQARRRR